MLDAIDAARESARLEMYIFNSGIMADRFRLALTAAARRGVKVQVLLDAAGSLYLPGTFWAEFSAAGGELRWFNPLRFSRLGFRDHRKLLVCDETVAFVGGFNISAEYVGDGVKSGWRDLGLRVTGSLANRLAVAFDDMFVHADFKHRLFARLRKSPRQRAVNLPETHILLGGPGRSHPLKRALHHDLKSAHSVQLMTAYFLPSWRLRRDLARVVRQGGRAQLILPGRTDLPTAQRAARHFYTRLLRAGVEIYEYQPQVLHAKLFVIDQSAYAGLANLDVRSLSINYELMLRLSKPAVVEEARAIFENDLGQCRRIELKEWTRRRSFFDILKSRWSCFLLARLDPAIARHQWRSLR